MVPWNWGRGAEMAKCNSVVQRDAELEMSTEAAAMVVWLGQTKESVVANNSEASPLAARRLGPPLGLFGLSAWELPLFLMMLALIGGGE